MLGQCACAAPVHCMRVPAASLQVLLGGHLLLAKAVWNMLSRAAARAHLPRRRRCLLLQSHVSLRKVMGSEHPSGRVTVTCTVLMLADARCVTAMAHVCRYKLKILLGIPTGT